MFKDKFWLFRDTILYLLVYGFYQYTTILEYQMDVDTFKNLGDFIVGKSNNVGCSELSTKFAKYYLDLPQFTKVVPPSILPQEIYSILYRKIFTVSITNTIPPPPPKDFFDMLPSP